MDRQSEQVANRAGQDGQHQRRLLGVWPKHVVPPPIDTFRVRVALARAVEGVAREVFGLASRIAERVLGLPV